ncbi:MAG: AAA family ATPase [Flavobacteriaceae bacterium]|nr:AAA family ATPase [Flavobacteriaceae bacterium]
MISKINLDNIASYKKPTSLETDKKVNLIYGLNGTGKSTLSNFLYNKDDSDFWSCSIEGMGDEDILVYNQRFISDFFYEPDNLKGIFTLSKENKEAEQKVRNAEKEIIKLNGSKSDKAKEVEDKKTEILVKKTNSEKKLGK